MVYGRTFQVGWTCQFFSSIKRAKFGWFFVNGKMFRCSQNEFIELVGFDEPQKEEKIPSGKPKRERRRSKRERGGENSMLRFSRWVEAVLDEICNCPR